MHFSRQFLPPLLCTSVTFQLYSASHLELYLSPALRNEAGLTLHKFRQDRQHLTKKIVKLLLLVLGVNHTDFQCLLRVPFAYTLGAGRTTLAMEPHPHKHHPTSSILVIHYRQNMLADWKLKLVHASRKHES